MSFFVKRFDRRGARLAVSLFVLMSAMVAVGTPMACARPGVLLSESMPKPFSEPLPAIEVSELSRQTDKVVVFLDRSDTDRLNALIDISSEFGIGRATVKLAQGTWPESVTVRLHLRGLEGFTVSNGTTVMEKHQLSVQAYNLNRRLFSWDDSVNEAGYYEVRLPALLFAEGATVLQIQWIDFYRR